jgi:hypothetical protein
MVTPTGQHEACAAHIHRMYTGLIRIPVWNFPSQEEALN